MFLSMLMIVIMIVTNIFRILIINSKQDYDYNASVHN